MDTITITTAGSVTTVTLQRPDARNAFNEKMIIELSAAFSNIAEDTRAVVLTGAGDVFCAGADVNWMRDSINRTEDENKHDAAAMERMFSAVDQCPAPVIGRVNGAALGGGMGLVASCDIAVAVDSAQFGYTEVRLGIVPAVISPFSIAKIGSRAARRYFLTGELFNATRARDIGLVHEVVPASALDETVDAIAGSLLKNGPQAVRIAKRLAIEVGQMDRAQAREHTIATIARVRRSSEGQEGLTAFLEKRKPNWIK